MRVISIYISLAVIFSVQAIYAHPSVLASERELVKKEKKLEDVKKKIRETKESIKEISRTETTILGELEKLNKTLVEKREELGRVNGSLNRITREIKRSDANLRVLEKERQSLSKRLRLRLRAMYKMRKGGAVKVLFASESSRDLGRRYKYMAIIMGTDASLLEKCENNLTLVAKERARLNGLQKDLSTERGKLKVAKRQTESRLKEKNKLLQGVKRKKARHLRLVKEFEGAKVELGELISRLRKRVDQGLKGEFAAMKGRLVMPVNGRVVSFYGKVKHPKFKTVTFNNGIVIEATFGSRIKSVYKGKVVYVGWLKGYGQVMIIDHGDGFYTLYGHLYKVLKQRGEMVDRGEEVGLVGDSGVHDVSGLYFEVRQGGVPRDPMAWIAGR
jgi:septal ring factor EnvC (AmiA/AmiB activator)